MVVIKYLLATLIGVHLAKCDQKVKIVPKSLAECELDEGGQKATFTADLVDIGGGNQAFTGKIELTKDIDASLYEFKANIDEYQAGEWIKDQIILDGNLCDYLSEQFAKLWGKVRDKSDPPIKDECFVPAGTYKIDNFEAEADDVEGVGLKGTFRTTLKIYDENNVNIICRLAEGDLVDA